MNRLILGLLLILTPYFLFSQSAVEMLEQKEAEIEVGEKYFEALVVKLENAQAELRAAEHKNEQAQEALATQKMISYTLVIAILVAISLLFVVLKNSNKRKERLGVMNG